MAFSSVVPLPALFCSHETKSASWSLPSIAHFDHPAWRESPPAYDFHEKFDSSMPSPLGDSSPSPPPPPPPPVEPPSMKPITHPFWFGHNASSQTVAEKTCEMVSYLWFSSSLGAPRASPLSLRARVKRAPKGASRGDSPPPSLSNASSAALQFSPSPHFVQFMQKLLQTTQVSQSVIVLSLHYIYRLKEENHFTNGQAGSEFRVAVVALMMANKFVDDNTYTNKTWSEVSGIELSEINKMEREFLLGVGFKLYVDLATYKSWVQLLKGLVAAKERDAQQWQFARRRADVQLPIRAPIPRRSHSSLTAPIPTPRARSSSPLLSLKAPFPFTFNAPGLAKPSHPRHDSQQPMHNQSFGLKRPAVVAFSPHTATQSLRPSKRPISLDMSLIRRTTGPASAAPAYQPYSATSEPLSAFSKLSLATPSRPQPSRQPLEGPQTLAAPYNVQNRFANSDPPSTLYYYALAGSPAGRETDSRARKAELRSHHPVYYPTQYLPPPRQPMFVQSATASPAGGLAHLRPAASEYALPHPPPNFSAVTLPPIRTLQRHYDDDRTPSQPLFPSHVPVAPFANAGPPGIQHWPIQSSTDLPSSAHASHYVQYPHHG